MANEALADRIERTLKMMEDVGWDAERYKLLAFDLASCMSLHGAEIVAALREPETAKKDYSDKRTLEIIETEMPSGMEVEHDRKIIESQDSREKFNKTVQMYLDHGWVSSETWIPKGYLHRTLKRNHYYADIILRDVEDGDDE